jgi:hypothetical protein
MKILIVHDNYKSGDDRTRLNFLLKLNRFPDVDLKIVNNISISDTRLENIIRFKSDIILFPFYTYDLMQMWDERLFTLGIKTVILEEDHYESQFDSGSYFSNPVLAWYKKNKISLLLRRHCYKTKAPVESVWLPFSANEEECNYSENYAKIHDWVRLKSIGFAGSYTDPQVYYDIRRLAITTLLEANLLDNFYGKVYDQYFAYLESHIGCLACTGGFLHTCLAKTFEIPLSGSVLLTNRMDHSDLLWGDKKCYFEYKDDCSDIVDIAKYILTNNNEVNIVRMNGLTRTIEYHTDYHRLVELYNILKALIDDKEIPRKWGQ